MIVRDERHVIERCLDSVVDFIDYWVISDTGSTDGTQALICEYFENAGIPGELVEHEWRNFGHNRTVAIELANGKADYILIMDADDVFVHSDRSFLRDLNLDGYRLKYSSGSTDYWNVNLVRSGLPWKWRGILHEYLDCDAACETEILKGNYFISSRREGARSQVEDKYLQDAEVLERGLAADPENTRYRFYLAQSYRDAGDDVRAVLNYQKRAEAGGWVEEVYCSLLEIAYAQRRLGIEWPIVMNSFLKAHQYRPTRLEGLYEAVRHCRENRLWALGYGLAKEYLSYQSTDDVLFVVTEIYLWKLMDEFSVCASWLGRWDEAVESNLTILEYERLPEDERRRIRQNLELCESMNTRSEIQTRVY